jgi:peptidoglycan/xylan/chitin deacetylase (PgdA/CDA1 family)
MANIRQLLKLPLQMAAASFGPQRRSRGEPKLWVLMYHRILPASDPRFASEEPGMVVTPETLRAHLRIAKQLFTIVSLEEWIRRRNDDLPLPPRACAITFDDGWLDNFQYALPVLESEGVPATIFVVSEMLGTEATFWPNRLASLLARFADAEVRAAAGWLQPMLPAELNTAPDSEQLAAIIDRCKQQSDAWLCQQLNQAEARVGTSAADTSPALMDWDQLTQMVATGLVDVGSHTCNHYRLLPALETEVMEREITASKRQIEQQLGRPVTLFCYPNGDADERATALVREHYLGAVTTQRGINAAGAQAHQLARIGLHEDGAGSALRFQARLSGWV